MDLTEANKTLNKYIRPQSLPIVLKPYKTDVELPARARTPTRNMGHLITIKKYLFLILVVLFFISCTTPVQHRMELFRHIGPKDKPTRPSTVIQLEMSQAEAANWRGLIAGKDDLNYEKAIKNFTEAIAFDPLYAIAYCNRGIAYSKLGKYDVAIADYDQAIKLYPNYSKAYFNRAFTYSKLTDYARALKDYTEAIRHNPRNANAHVLRGVIYSKLGEMEKACEDQKRSCELGICEGLQFAQGKGLCR